MVMWAELKRSKIAVRGSASKIPMKGLTAVEEHTHFLHSLLTNNVRDLKPYRFNYHLQLKPNGQPVADYFLYNLGDHYLLDTERPPSEVIEEFSRLKLSLKVHFEDLTPRFRHIFIFGESAGKVVEETFRVKPAEFELAVVGDTIVARNPLRFGVDGYDLIGDLKGLDLPASAVADEDLLERLRVENCVPRIGKELREGFSPLEAGVLPYAIDLNKGCYVGQEAIARVYFRGRTPRALVRFSVSGNVREGDEIYAGEKRVGLVTSVSGSTALGYVLRAYLEEKRLRTAEGELRVVRVCGDG